VEVTDAHVTYRGHLRSTTRHALRGVSLSVARGETLGVVGESGCGKSTLARLIAGLVPASAGRIAVDGVELGDRRSRARLRTHVQMVFQDPTGSLSPRRTVRQSLEEPLLAVGTRARERTERISRLLDQVGLDPVVLERRPHEISGGQAQRVGIARALAVDPQVVIFDEPTSALDVTVQAQILDLITELAGSHDRAYVFISHDLATVRSACDTVAVLYLGQIVEYGPVDVVYDDPRHPYTQALFGGIPNLGASTPTPRVQLATDLSEADAEHGCSLRPRCPLAGPDCAVAPPAVPIGVGRIVRCWRVTGDAPADTTSVATIPIAGTQRTRGDTP